MSKAKRFSLEADEFSLLSKGFIFTEAEGRNDVDSLVIADRTYARAKTEFTGETGRYKVVLHFDLDADEPADMMLKFKVGSEKVKLRANDLEDDGKMVLSEDIFLEEGRPLKLAARFKNIDEVAIEQIEFIPLDPPAQKVREQSPATKKDDRDDEEGGGSDHKSVKADKTPKLGAFEAEVLALTNELREDRGLDPLRWNKDLAEAAQGHNRDMADNGFFSHRGSDGDRSADRAVEAGYDSRYVGENLAAGYRDPEAVVDAWFRSAGHRKNLLRDDYEEIGIDYYFDGDSKYAAYWTQMFGTDFG
jgi:uncharacterized protein YkwD